MGLSDIILLVGGALGALGIFQWFRGQSEAADAIRREKKRLEEETEETFEPTPEEEQAHEELEKVDKELEGQDEADKSEDAQDAAGWLNDRYSGSGSDDA